MGAPPPAGGPPSHGGPPPGGPPYGGPPSGPPPGSPRPPGGGRRLGVATTLVGMFAWLIINFAVFMAVLATEGAPAAVATVAIVLAAVAFGGGGALTWAGFWTGRPWISGLGLGLLIGWALMSIVTAGYCTGLNPDLYTEAG